MPSVINAICELLVCEPSDLHKALDDPDNFYRVELFLMGKQLTTTHGSKPVGIRCSYLSHMDATYAKFFNGSRMITVQDHLLSRHHIGLKYPQLTLVCEQTNKEHRNYYPLELLNVYADREYH